MLRSTSPAIQLAACVRNRKTVKYMLPATKNKNKEVCMMKIHSRKSNCNVSIPTMVYAGNKSKPNYRKCASIFNFPEIVIAFNYIKHTFGPKIRPCLPFVLARWLLKNRFSLVSASSKYTSIHKSFIVSFFWAVN
jgi:hypothetical protein